MNGERLRQGGPRRKNRGKHLSTKPSALSITGGPHSAPMNEQPLTTVPVWSGVAIGASWMAWTIACFGLRPKITRHGTPKFS